MEEEQFIIVLKNLKKINEKTFRDRGSEFVVMQCFEEVYCYSLTLTFFVKYFTNFIVFLNKYKGIKPRRINSGNILEK